MTSGHGGCMGTLHATHPKDTLTRLETMCMMSDIDMPLAAMRQQIGSGVQLVVQVSRLQDGSRKVTHITEVMGFDLETQHYLLQDLFVRDYRGFDEQQRIVSDLVPTGILPSCLPQLHEHGVSLPEPVLEMAKRRPAETRRGAEAMAGENELIEISLLSGQSDRQSITFTPGTPANPVSVGTAGQWNVTGEGVGPVHVYIVFDGRSVHVASAAPSAHVLLAGAPVGASWMKAPIPCELRFGGACVIMRYARATGAAHAEEERTVHDGGALWQAAQKAVQDAIDKSARSPAPGRGPPRPAASSLPPARPAPRARRRTSGATVPMGDQQAFRDALAKATSSAPAAFGGRLADDDPSADSPASPLRRCRRRRSRT